MLHEEHALFARKIAAIHQQGLSAEQHWSEEGEMDLGRAETEAMIESFLGPGYPRPKVEKVVHAQKVFRETQQHLLTLFNLGEFDAGEYVARVNQVSDEAMAICLAVLGDEDFRALFGGSLNEVQRSVRIDPETFALQQQQLLAETSSFQARGA